MGLDLYMEARILEKKTKRVISSDVFEEYVDEGEKGFFEICWWCSRDFFDIREKMIKLCNQYAGTAYTDSDIVIPIPQPALREIYAYLVKRSCISEEEPFEVLPCNMKWQEIGSYEKMNLINAEKLHDLLWTLDSIKYSNHIDIEQKYIPDKNDFILLKENPQAYEWEFRIFNSY